jgi:hypothetical protein
LVGAGVGVATCIGALFLIVRSSSPVVTTPSPRVLAAQVPLPAPPAAAPAQVMPAPAAPSPPAPPVEGPAPAPAQTHRVSTRVRHPLAINAEPASPSAAAAPAAQEPPPTVGRRDKLDDLLDAALGSKAKPSRPRSDEAVSSETPPVEKPPAPARLPVLDKNDIVRAMMGVQPKVKDCYNQYKVPGTAMVFLKIARGGRVSDATVSGKFAGTATGTCVEEASKTAQFPAVEGTTFYYPVPLH